MKKLTIDRKEYEIEDEVSDLMIMISRERDDLKKYLKTNKEPGLEGLREWAIKEREKLEAYAEKNGSRYLDPNTWGQIDMIVKVENKIAELMKAA